MNRRLVVPLAALAVAAVPAAAVTFGGVATAAESADPPSVVQLCAQTGIDGVDSYLAALADSDLVGDLAPLLDLTVPRDGDGLAVEADVSLEQVRDALDCGEDTPTTTTPAPTTTNPPDDDDDDSDDNDDDDDSNHCRRCDQVDVPPRGGVNTGDGSTPILA